MNGFIDNGDGTATIVINSKGKEYNILIDAEDLLLIKRFNWIIRYPSREGGKIYAIDSKTKQYMHRLITNCPKGKEVDHINGNSLDNRRCNLRITTTWENNLNRNAGNKNNTTGGIRNIYKINDGRYRVYVNHNKKTRYLGTYDDLQSAIKARDNFWQKFRDRAREIEGTIIKKIIAEDELYQRWLETLDYDDNISYNDIIDVDYYNQLERRSYDGCSSNVSS